MSGSSFLIPALRDILFDGHVVCRRNPAGRRFTARDAVRLEAAWSTFNELEAAYRSVKAEAEHSAASSDVAWDAEFGFLSPNPANCGNNIFIDCLVHLEALNLVGDLKPLMAGLDALRMDAWGYDVESIRDPGHFYRLVNRFSLGVSERELVTRVTNAIRAVVKQEINARMHLLKDDRLLLADALARALAILRHARLLSPWETIDLLSPLRMMAGLGLVTGITVSEIDRFIFKQLDTPPDPCETNDEIRARDRRDASFANRMNRRFARVDLTAPAKKWLSL